MSRESIYWVYILECDNGSYYTGYTNHLIKRFRSHVAGKGGKYTRSFKPLRLLHSWTFEDKSQAMRFEKLIKLLSREEKQTIILAAINKTGCVS